MAEQQNYGYYLASNGVPTWVPERVTAQGERLMMDWLRHKLLQGKGFQIRAGTIATGVAMDSTLTDTAAEGCVDAVAGLTIVPIAFKIAFDEIATSTTNRVAVKAVGSVSSAGTVFVPLPLLQGGSSSGASARVANNGGVTVTAELATTTRRLFQYNAVYTQTPATDLANSASGFASVAANAAELNYVGKGPACVYVQCAATTAFPLYFFNLDWVEIDSDDLP